VSDGDGGRTIDAYETKEIECDKCGYVSRVAAFIPLKQAWCPQCHSSKIRLHKPDRGKAKED